MIRRRKAATKVWVGPTLDDRLRAWEERMRKEAKAEAALAAYRQARGMKQPAEADTASKGVWGTSGLPTGPQWYGLDDWGWTKTTDDDNDQS